ncbi:MAG: DUF3299 domain-containing protein [Steroidobacteraceae bacterium]
MSRRIPLLPALLLSCAPAWLGSLAATLAPLASAVTPPPAAPATAAPAAPAAATGKATPAIGTPAPAGAPPVGTTVPASPGAGAGATAKKGGPRELDWDELVPKDARSRFAGTPPAPIHDYLGEGGPAAMQVLDFSTNAELDGAEVRLPGFIVPLDVGKDGKVSEFFLVPYFGACIHVPPPPPNQIVFVKMKQGIALDSIYEAYWITGRMSLQRQETKLGAAAYQIVASGIEIYKY